MAALLQRQPEPEVMDLAAEADAYAAADFAQVNQAFVERLVELAGDRPGAKALDLGTGPADIPIRLARLRPGWRIVAADASAPMLEHARKLVRQARLTEVVELVLVDAKATAFAPHSFDVIFSNSILHHLPDATPFWSEVKRLAKPGATVLMRDLARPADAEAARRVVRQYAGTESSLLQEEYYRSLLAAYTPDEVRSQLVQAGLTSLQAVMVTDRHLDVFGRTGG